MRLLLLTHHEIASKISGQGNERKSGNVDPVMYLLVLRPDSYAGGPPRSPSSGGLVSPQGTEGPEPGISWTQS